MKKGFTLIEMLIVVVVLVTLMSIVFRLSGVASSQSERAKTITRMQRLENCLSGYYAAFGSYPPVRVHGSRDIYLEVNGRGEQNLDGTQKTQGENGSNLNWSQVEAACRSQPVACEFPFDTDQQQSRLVEKFSETCKKLAEGGQKEWANLTDEQKRAFDAGFTSSAEVMGQLRNYSSEVGWDQVQLFKFGLMSYLVPRLTVMMNIPDDSVTEAEQTTVETSDTYDDYSQWFGCNAKPHDPATGRQVANWRVVQSWSANKRRAVPSQAVCARWMANLEKICTCNTRYDGKGVIVFGVELNHGEENYSLKKSPECMSKVHRAGGYGEKSYGNQYLLDGMTVRDGWGNDFYYYSPPPYQNYVLWSSGANGKTFPPWIERTSLSSAEDIKLAGEWVADDITHLSN